MSVPDDPSDIEGYVALIAQLRAELADAPKIERERLAAFIEANGEVMRSFQDGAMTPEFVCFLLRLDHG